MLKMYPGAGGSEGDGQQLGPENRKVYGYWRIKKKCCGKIYAPTIGHMRLLLFRNLWYLSSFCLSPEGAILLCSLAIPKLFCWFVSMGLKSGKTSFLTLTGGQATSGKHSRIHGCKFFTN